MLNGVLKYREFISSGEIDEDITKVWNKFIFNEVQSVFHSWTSRLATVIKNEEEYMIE
jgi:hypothetical protein